MLDLLILHGLLYDGVCREGRVTNIGIQGNKIVALDIPDDTPAAVVLNAEGLTIIPGMIDVHAHTDTWVMQHPDCLPAVSQGVTTQIVGPCGIGVFPLRKDQKCYVDSLRAILGDETECYESCEAYLNALPQTSINIAAQASHSPLRMACADFNDHLLNDYELRKLEDLTERMFCEGACGLTTGLAYYPASFGDTAEVAALCRVAAKYDVPVAIHQRTALRSPTPQFNPHEEVLEFARKSGAHLQYSHYRTGLKDAGQIEKLLEPIVRGQQEGLNITADFYPYPVGAGYALVALPMWVWNGGPEGILALLENPETRKRIVDELQNKLFTSDSVITHAPQHPEYVGRTFGEIAESQHRTVPEMLTELLLEEKLNVGYQLGRNFPENVIAQLEKDFSELIRLPYYMLGSDTLPGQGLLHPRTWGTFPRAMRLALSHGVDMGTFVRNVCAQPARSFHLKNRGTVIPGSFADLCVLDETKLMDHATFENPTAPADGIRYVYVNGKCVYRDGNLTGVRSGWAVRRNV